MFKERQLAADYDADPTGTFFNRVQTFEIGAYPNTETVPPFQ